MLLPLAGFYFIICISFLNQLLNCCTDVVLWPLSAERTLWSDSRSSPLSLGLTECLPAIVNKLNIKVRLSLILLVLMFAALPVLTFKVIFSGGLLIAAVSAG